jgi:hypothetical protein
MILLCFLFVIVILLLDPQISISVMFPLLFILAWGILHRLLVPSSCGTMLRNFVCSHVSDLGVFT